MEVIINLLIIQFLLVFVLDYTDAVDELFTPLVKRLTGAKIGRLGKPWSCSTCMSVWLGLLYLLCVGHFTFPYLAFVAFLAAMTPVTLDIIWFVRDFLQTVIFWFRYITGIK